jgi:hypothetical protein
VDELRSEGCGFILAVFAFGVVFVVAPAVWMTR